MKQITQALSDLPYTLVNFGVDTLILNVRYADEHGAPLRSELCEEYMETLNLWQAQAREQEKPVPVPSLVFRRANLLMHPHGAGKGQWRWLLTSDDLNVCISRGRLNGILAQVRLSARLLWSSETDTHDQDLWTLLQEVDVFLTSLFATSQHPHMHLQVSEIHLCADIAGWDVAHCYDWQATMLTRARRRRTHGSYTPPEPDDCQTHGCPAASGSFLWQGPDDAVPEPVYSGHTLETIEFGSHGSVLSCVIYNKSREIKKSGKTWMPILWGYHGHDGETDVTRVEFRWGREALHTLKQEGVFHGIESLADLKERLSYLWTYSAGHVQGGPDGVPDGWLRYVAPSADTNPARWPVHPAWLVVQSAFTTHTEPAVNTTTGEVIDDHPVSAPLAELIRERHYQQNSKRLAQQVGGCCSTLAAYLTPREQEEPMDLFGVFEWLFDHLPVFAAPEVVAQAEAEGLSAEEVCSLVAARFDTTFAETVQEKQVYRGVRQMREVVAKKAHLYHVQLAVPPASARCKDGDESEVSHG